MRTIEYKGQFKRDYKREAKGKHRVDLVPVLEAWADDQPLSLDTMTMRSLVNGKITVIAT